MEGINLIYKYMYNGLVTVSQEEKSHLPGTSPIKTNDSFPNMPRLMTPVHVQLFLVFKVPDNLSHFSRHDLAYFEARSSILLYTEFQYWV